MRAAQQLVSLDKPVGDDADAAEFGDLIPDESAPRRSTQAVESMRDERLQSVPRQPAYRDKRILELRYGLGGEEPQTLDKVAKLFGLTRERTRQVEEARAAQALHAGRRAGAARRGLGAAAVTAAPCR